MALVNKRQVATFLRKFPWLFSLALGLFRLTRPRYSAGVVGVVINDDGQILFVEHVMHPRTPWGLPGGWVEWGEDPAQTLKREMREELALDVQVGPIVALERGTMMHLDIAYLCKPLGQVGGLSVELLDYRWAERDDFPALHRFHRLAVQSALNTLSHELWS